MPTQNAPCCQLRESRDSSFMCELICMPSRCASCQSATFFAADNTCMRDGGSACALLSTERKRADGGDEPA